MVRTTWVGCERLALARGILRSGGICSVLASIEAANTVESPILFLVQI
jgi:hypothetical protein